MIMGVHTFLVTDIEGSTRLAGVLGDAWPSVLADHHRILRAAFAAGHGEEMGNAGDGFAVAFDDPTAAVVAAAETQRELAGHDWRGGLPVRVRAGLHTGTATLGDSGWTGLAIHQTARISSAAHGGQVLLSGATADLVTGALPEGVILRDLGHHNLRDLGEPVRLFQLVIADVDDDARLPLSLDRARHNLPVQLSTFVGRRDEIIAVSKRLSDARLVTLVGPGGVGKSRLAAQVAAAQIDRYPGGLWLVELSSVSNGELVEREVAGVLGVREEPLRPLSEALAERVGSAPTLVLLDNCEHVLDGAAAVAATLLKRCPALSVLATSIEPLRLPGEVLEAVSPLAIDEGPDHGAATGPAVRLFLDRASAVDPSFTLDAGTSAAVARLCERLDGMPLAIELAAARAATLTPDQLNDRLSERFTLLTGGPRTAEARHRTLRAVVDWSVELLAPVERSVLERLSVFRGGWTLEAAEHAVSGDGVADTEVLDALSGLVDRSLVFVQGGGLERRYRLLETIRAYGEDRLEETDRLEAARDRHLSWLATLASHAEPELAGGEQAKWFDLLEVELGNVQAALEWSSSSPQRAKLGLAIASELLNFWLGRGLRYEGIAWLERLVRLAEATPRQKVEALFGAGLMAVLSWPATAIPLVAAASELAGDDAQSRAVAAVLRGFLEICSGDIAAARNSCDQARELTDGQLGDSPAGLWLSGATALVALTGDPVIALHLMESTRRRFEDAGDIHASGFWRSFEGLLHHVIGDDQVAATAINDGRRIADGVRCPSCRSFNLSVGALLNGRPLSERRDDLVVALELSDAISETMTRVESLRAFVILAGEAGEHDRAARLGGAVDAICRQSGYALYSSGLSDALERAKSYASVKMGPERFNEARRAGANLSYPDVVALARASGEGED